MSAPLLEIADLSVAYEAGEPVVRNVSLTLSAGEVVGLVGESGSGKSTLALSVARLLPAGARILGGSIRLDGADVLAATPKMLRDLRRREIGVLFQNPITSLDPTMRVGRQLLFALGGRSDRGMLISALERVKLRDAERLLELFPHNLSGGIAQRVALALALARGPKLLIVDEPTSALDASIAAEILDLLVDQRDESGMAILLLSHDLPAIAARSDHIAVMQGGRIVEQGESSKIFARPEHNYTRQLLAALQPSDQAASPPTSKGKVLAALEHVRMQYRGKTALHDLNLKIFEGETLALIGESGSGKTTVARLLLGLQRPTSGTVTVNGKRPDQWSKTRLGAVMQHPDWALNPRLRVAASVGEPLAIRHVAGRTERVDRALTEVGLSPEFGRRYPGELSGGQRQRVSIARALIVEPEFVVFDEPISALDAATQGQVTDLFTILRDRLRFTSLFISHNLLATRRFANRIAVLYAGELVESAPVQLFYDRPRHPYSQMLLAAANGRRLATKQAFTSSAAAVGCAFASRCPFATALCHEARPSLRQLGATMVACHNAEELSQTGS